MEIKPINSLHIIFKSQYKDGMVDIINAISSNTGNLNYEDVIKVLSPKVNTDIDDQNEICKIKSFYVE